MSWFAEHHRSSLWLNNEDLVLCFVGPAKTVMPAPSLPPGLNAVAIIRPALHDILIGQSFTVVIFVLLLALFYFSTPSGRQKPIFILNVVTILLAIAVGVLLDYRGVRICFFERYNNRRTEF